MKEVSLTRRFPGGVSDPEGRRGFVGLAGGQVIALDLKTGAVIWSRHGLGQPIAATLSRLVTLNEEGTEVGLPLIDAESGQALGRVSELDLPSWARYVISEPDAAQFEAKNEGPMIRVSWSLRQPYRGGAPPGPTIAESRPTPPATGGILFDPASGAVLEKGPGVTPAERSEPATSTDPNVLAQEQIGDRIYRLKVAQGAERRAEMTVEACGAESGDVEWEVPVGSVPDTGPAPQRK
jgi:hypothetical protein